MASELTVNVPKGVKVNVIEMDNVSDPDPRIPSDRNVIVSATGGLKVALKRADEDTMSAKASVVLMCG
jgi:hypothetical protein